ncbi:hypothetical protein KR044_008160 [Drosophila immigrans]|nr:hypothetical protein KR044_008160 [Drosophila immigrans]
MEKLPSIPEEAAAGEAPSTSTSLSQQPKQTLFQWMSLNNLPMLEDETPPISFCEVLGSAEVAVHCSQCSRLLVSLGADALERTIGTQTQVMQLMQAQTQTQTQHIHLGPQQKHTQTERDPSEVELAMEVQLEWYLQQLRHRRLGQQQQHLQRAFWSLLKTLLICISVLNGCYLLCRGLWRLSIWRRLLVSLYALEETPPLPPASNSLPALLYRKLCGLARMLHMI